MSEVLDELARSLSEKTGTKFAAFRTPSGYYLSAARDSIEMNFFLGIKITTAKQKLALLCDLINMQFVPVTHG